MSTSRPSRRVRPCFDRRALSNTFTAVAATRCAAEVLERRMLLAADLTGAFAGSVPDSLPPGGKNRIRIRIDNIGDDLAAGTIGVTLFASTDAAFDAGDTPIATASKRLKLKGGHATAAKLAFPSPTGLSDGDYFLIAQVDDANAISETDEGNNTVPTATAVSIRQPFVDLTGTLQGLPTSVTIGAKPKTVKATVLVHNGGNVPARGPVAVALYASADGQLDSGDTPLATLPAKNVNIKPGKSKGLKVKVSLPTDTPGGDFFVIAAIDSAGGVPESDESNNDAASPAALTVINANAPAAPTLAGALAVDTTTFVAGQSDQIEFAVNVAHATPGAAVEVDEVDASGNLVGKVTDLFDNGDSLAGDRAAGDGAFNNTAAITFAAPADRFFVAKLTDGSTGATQQTAAVKVAGVAPPTDAQAQRAVDDNRTLQQELTDAIAHMQSLTAALDAANAKLLAHPEIAQPGSIDRTPQSIAWKTPEGILSIVSGSKPQAGAQQAALSAAARSTAPASSRPAALTVAPAADEAPTPDACKRALVLAPYAFDFEPKDEADDIGNILANKGWTVAQRRNASQGDANVTLDDFRNLNQYAAIVISTHGETFGKYGTVLDTDVPAGFFSQQVTNKIDLSTGRLAVFGGTYAITSRFITRYSGFLDGAIVYVSGCKSTGDASSMVDTFLNRGAGAYIGYSDYVATSFAYPHGLSAFSTLLQTDHNTLGDIPGINADVETDSDPARFDGFGDPSTKLKTECAAVRDYDLFLQYSWPQTQKDLDSATLYDGLSAGFEGDNNSPYLNWSGDNTSTGGTETTLVDLAQALTDGKVTPGGIATVTADAGWYTPSSGSGPAILTVALKNKVTGATRDAIQKVISPGNQTGRAATTVATITVTISNDADPEISFTVT